MTPKRKSKKIIIDEKTEAEKILSAPVEKYITRRTMTIISKYYYSLGLNYKQTKKKLLEYCFKSEDFNLTLREESIDKILNCSKFYSLKSSSYRIPITKKEIKKLKCLSHGDYQIALYMLFITKLERFQNLKKNKNKAKSFTAYFNHDIRTAHYNVINEKNGGKNGAMSEKDELELLYRLSQAGIIEVTYKKNSVMLCADFDNTREIAFIIDASKNFNDQIIYYCCECGNETTKNKTGRCKTCSIEKSKKDSFLRLKKYREKIKNERLVR